VLYFGADGDEPIAAGGRFDEAGVFVSNRTRETSVPGSARVRLPVFREADPLDLEVEAMEIDLVPDGTGYVATIHGAIRGKAAADAAADGILQMVASNPSDHLNMWAIFDANPENGVITRFEVLTNDLFSSLMAPDLALFVNGTDALSIGFQAHLRPALSGDPPAAPCFESRAGWRRDRRRLRWLVRRVPRRRDLRQRDRLRQRKLHRRDLRRGDLLRRPQGWLRERRRLWRRVRDHRPQDVRRRAGLQQRQRLRVPLVRRGSLHVTHSGIVN